MSENGTPFWRLIFAAAEQIRNSYSRKNLCFSCGETAITVSQSRVLGALLIGEEKGRKVKDLAWELGITPGAVSQIVDSLVRMGLVSRSECPDDRRSVTIMLSESGAELRRKLDHEFSELVERLFADVSPEEQQVFRSVLVKIILSIENEKIQEKNHEKKKQE